MLAPAERVIKRYDNRKLYDPLAKRYVTLDGLARLIAAGQDVSVRDQKSGEDITTTVLAHVILEALKERTARIPRQVLLRLIRLGMTPSPAARRAALRTPLDAAARAREEAEKIVAGLLKRGGLPLEEALALRQEIAATLHKAVGEAQRGLEQRFHSLMEWTERESGISPALQALKERLLTFESSAAGRPARRKPRRPRSTTTPQRNRQWKEP
jgi:polyhydroxyalkanoate synthesis repressor PhaR